MPPKRSLKRDRDIEITTTSVQGTRDSQEDRVILHTFKPPFEHLTLFGVLDGHGGSLCADFGAKFIPWYIQQVLSTANSKNPRLALVLKDVVKAYSAAWNDFAIGKTNLKNIVDEETRRLFFSDIDIAKYSLLGRDSGTTVNIGLLDRTHRRISIANLGDSRSAWRIGPHGRPITATGDHGVGKETEQFTGFVAAIIDGRLAGDLAMTRAIGDLTPGLLGIINRTADISTFTIPVRTPSTVICASDGWWDEMSVHATFLNDVGSAREYVDSRAVWDDNTSMVMLKFK
jgi:serine/threonine protein phosphatase PrpC